jgi:KUP system potassium uptake protein
MAHDSRFDDGHVDKRTLGVMAPMVLGALGVVYGDIGTSPLYTMTPALQWGGGATPAVALGIFSLIVWTLLITTSVKYAGLVMRADNDGEGGILALMSLIGLRGKERLGIVVLGLLGAALLYGDGAITPAISVLSALEGVKISAPSVAPFVLPAAVAILVGLFVLQHKGTAVLGRLFGPVMVAWFLAIGALGLAGISAHPSVLAALNPVVGLHYLFTHGMTGFSVLGAVFLCSTGAEALYADMGHFGARPIRVGWYALVLPALVLNYGGQTALVVDGAVPADTNPFFLLAPRWLELPLVGLATLATIIASQAIISGVFSMTRQAIQLGLCPRLDITQTSDSGYGQIYVGTVNWLLMIFTLGLTLAFGSSDNLAAAYGIAVSLTMFLTTLLMFRMMRDVWSWSVGSALAVTALLGIVDLSFVSANLTKVREGGWVPLVGASAIFFLMASWHVGRAALADRLKLSKQPMAAFIAAVADVRRVPGTAVYLTRNPELTPLALLHSLRHFEVLHERVIVLHVETEHVPRVPTAGRGTVTSLGSNFFQLDLRYGFVEHPNIPRALGRCTAECGQIDPEQTTYILSREVIGSAHPSRLNFIVRKIFAWMHHNAGDAVQLFRIPRERLVELGASVEI